MSTSCRRVGREITSRPSTFLQLLLAHLAFGKFQDVLDLGCVVGGVRKVEAVPADGAAASLEAFGECPVKALPPGSGRREHDSGAAALGQRALGGLGGLVLRQQAELVKRAGRLGVGVQVVEADRVDRQFPGPHQPRDRVLVERADDSLGAVRDGLAVQIGRGPRRISGVVNAQLGHVAAVLLHAGLDADADGAADRREIPADRNQRSQLAQVRLQPLERRGEGRQPAERRVPFMALFPFLEFRLR